MPIRILSNPRGLIIFILLLYSVRSFGQRVAPETDSLVDKINYYGIKQSRSVLFAHFDKSIYVNNENVWFTAYLLKYNKNTNDPSVLSVMLVNDYKKSIALEQKFVMGNGLAFGNVFIPDSIPPGNYSFVLYTNVLTNGKPNDIFMQPITIKLTTRPELSASLTPLDTGKTVAGGNRKIELQVTTKDDRPIAMAGVEYYLGNSGHHVLSGHIKTDEEGQYIFSIPESQIKPGNNEFTADIKYNKEVKHIRLLLPVKDNPVSIKFYPEGGSLVNATQSTVGWEARDVNGAPVSIKGILYKDKRPVDTIKTDRYGMGSFKLIPLIESKYELRLTGEQIDTSYTLPKILTKGPVISMPNALTNDTLKLNLLSKYPGKFFIMVHNYKQTFFSFPVEIKAMRQKIAVVLKDVPKGLNTITVLDSTQRPCAERIFFAHYDQRTPIVINTDSAAYHTRQKVHLKLKLGDNGADTLKGMVSVACIQASRVDAAKTNDIESYVYLKHELEDIPIKEKYIGQSPEDRNYLEKVLLIKGWRRYHWTDMLQAKASDTILSRKNIEFTGRVTLNDKPVNWSEDIMVRNDSVIKMLLTQKNGWFKLSDESIRNSTNKGVMLLLNHYEPGYKISLNNDYDRINRELLNGFKPNDNYIAESKIENANAEVITGFEHSINLRTVTIKGARDKYGSSAFSSYGSNACGDYVCYMNILNCQNHYNDRRNRPPKRGERYMVVTSEVNDQTMQRTFGTAGNFSWIIYQDCKVTGAGASAVTIRGITYSKEFYGEDYSIVNPSQPEYISTLYWKHLCYVNSKGDVDLKFYTSDITGAFKIIVQGVTANDVIYGEKEFKVNKP